MNVKKLSPKRGILVHKSFFGQLGNEIEFDLKQIDPAILAAKGAAAAIREKNVYNRIMDDKDIGWTKPALLRLTHIFTSRNSHGSQRLSNLFFGMVSSKMKVVSSDEKIISSSYIHPEDIKKYKQWRKSKNRSTETLYFRTNLDGIDLSIKKIQQVVKYFFNFKGLFFDRDIKIGNYKMNTNEKVEICGSRKSKRQSRKSFASNSRKSFASENL